MDILNKTTSWLTVAPTIRSSSRGTNNAKSTHFREPSYDEVKTPGSIDYIFALCAGSNAAIRLERKRTLAYFRSLQNTSSAIDPENWAEAVGGGITGLRDAQPSFRTPWAAPNSGITFKYRSPGSLPSVSCSTNCTVFDHDPNQPLIARSLSSTTTLNTTPSSSVRDISSGNTSHTFDLTYCTLNNTSFPAAALPSIVRAHAKQLPLDPGGEYAQLGSEQEEQETAVAANKFAKEQQVHSRTKALEDDGNRQSKFRGKGEMKDTSQQQLPKVFSKKLELYEGQPVEDNCGQKPKIHAKKVRFALGPTENRQHYPKPHLQYIPEEEAKHFKEYPNTYRGVKDPRDTEHRRVERDRAFFVNSPWRLDPAEPKGHCREFILMRDYNPLFIYSITNAAEVARNVAKRNAIILEECQRRGEPFPKLSFPPLHSSQPRRPQPSRRSTGRPGSRPATKSTGRVSTKRVQQRRSSVKKTRAEKNQDCAIESSTDEENYEDMDDSEWNLEEDVEESAEWNEAYYVEAGGSDSPEPPKSLRRCKSPETPKPQQLIRC